MLTAYNQDVQKYIQYSKLNKIRKDTMLDSIKEAVQGAELSFSKLFPNKQKLVLDEIVYFLTGKGIWKIGADKLAERVGCSERTVYNAVRAIKQTGTILVCRLADNNAGKYIFVYKDHPNFNDIMKHVFYIDSYEENAGQFAGLQNSEPIDIQGEGEENPSSNHIIKLLKQDIIYMQQSIELELLDSKNDKKRELEHVHTYYTNDYQFKLYHFIKSADYHKEINDHASIIGLRLGSNASKDTYISAIKVLSKMNSYVTYHEINSIPALFSSKLQEELDNFNKVTKTENEAGESNRKVVPLYNWLE
ncbi:helix-turn-helix domain-containing protein [Niallia taxi]|uniref:HTH domain-containing protein n=1 Tax=Niallia taxi TaxID=2499688 RepID=UPI0015F6CC89|nr:HTH domain-containing protein [Niallia taxi]